MPFPRPVSPITFETCYAVNENDNDYEYDLLGSDDELDDETRAAKRRKIEHLAQSYLRGNQLFILSASLRGPFERDWKNPWKKSRKTKSGRDSGSSVRPGLKSRVNGRKNTDDRVVQETDPQEKFRDLLTTPPAVVDSSASGPGPGPAELSRPSSRHESPNIPGSVSKSAVRLTAIDGQHLAPSRSAERVNEVSSYATDDQTIDAARTAEWLKKDRKRMNFRDFEPPSSPTPKIGPRHAEMRLRKSPSRLCERRGKKTASRDGSPRKSVAPVSVHTTPSSARIAVPVPRGPLGLAGRSPRVEKSLKRNGHAASSFRVMSSTSQLPRFEYRRRHQESGPPAPAQEQFHEPAFAPATGNDDDIPVVDAQEKVDVGVSRNESHFVEQSADQSKDLRLAAPAGTLQPTNHGLSIESEPNTCDNLPSAQQVSAPDASTRMPSLHSTVLPNTEAGPDIQLSTQAALLHAQKDFQDDLESHEQIFGKLPEQPLESPAPDDSVLLAHETPYYQQTTTDKALLRNSRHLVQERMQAMSTQCMLDAVSPYTFSTEKKPNAFRTISPPHIDSQKPRTRPDLSSPFPENEYQTAQSSRGGSSPREIVQPPEHEQLPTHRSTTQGTALPLTLSASPPTTAQDGQGGLQPPESFNLSQAIAEAGSWLQQSLEFFRDSSA